VTRPTRCQPFRHDLGAYVLDGLDAAEARAVEAHLRTCEACRGEHAELAGAPALLELARRAAPPPPGRVRDRVVAAAVGRRVARRWRGVAAAATLVAALLGGLVGWQVAPRAEPGVVVALEAAEPFEASGWATFRATRGGLAVVLDLDGLAPLAAPGVYEAWMATHDDRVVSIGQLPGSGRVSVTLRADGPAGSYRGFWITAEPDARDPAHDGPTVLRSRVPPLP
jgi:anti-sigma-K factor RskA